MEKPSAVRALLYGDRTTPLLHNETTLVRFALEAVIADPGRFAEMFPREDMRKLRLSPQVVKAMAAGLLYAFLTGNPPDDPPGVEHRRAVLAARLASQRPDVAASPPEDPREPWEIEADRRLKAVE